MEYDSYAVDFLFVLFALRNSCSELKYPEEPKEDTYEKVPWYSFTAAGLPAFVRILFLYNSYVDMSQEFESHSFQFHIRFLSRAVDGFSPFLLLLARTTFLEVSPLIFDFHH